MADTECCESFQRNITPPSPPCEPIISTTPPSFGGTYVTGEQAGYDERSVADGVFLLVCDLCKIQCTPDENNDMCPSWRSMAAYIASHPELQRPLAATICASAADDGVVPSTLDALTAIRWRQTTEEKGSAPVDVEVVAAMQEGLFGDDVEATVKFKKEMFGEGADSVVLARATGVRADGGWAQLSRTVCAVALKGAYTVTLRISGGSDGADAVRDWTAFDIRGALLDKDTRAAMALWQHAETGRNVEGL